MFKKASYTRKVIVIYDEDHPFIKNITEEEFIRWFYEKIKGKYDNTTLKVKEK